MLHHFDVVVAVLQVEPLTALSSVQEGHMVLLPKGVSQPLALAGLREADEEHLLSSVLEQLLFANSITNCRLQRKVSQ